MLPYLVKTPIIDILFALGVIINLLKGADLILRPHQQARIQAAMETVTLHLEELRPLRWLQWLTTPHGHKILLVIGLFEFGVVAIASQIFYLASGRRSELLLTLPFFGLSAVSIPYIVRHGPRLLRWLTAECRVARFFLRFVLVLLAGYAFLAVYQCLALLVLWLLFGGALSPDSSTACS